MSEPVNDRDIAHGPMDQTQGHGSTIRRQLILASLFPLVFFGLLSILVTSVAIYQVTLRLALQGNIAQVRAASDDLAKKMTGQSLPTNNDILGILHSLNVENGSRLFLVTENGNFLVGSNPRMDILPISSANLQTFIQSGKVESRLMVSVYSGNQAVISYAPLAAWNGGVILEVPWDAILAPTSYFQVLLVGILTIGTILSLYMLSLGIGRVIRPIADLANSATQAVPGSIFRPLPEQGPVEISSLIKAFNQMVIRLAEQQGTVRQYAQKALLSQEEERQRLSHELHDGTVQDLVGLVQRVELLRSELDTNPDQARRRLDELQSLVEQTLSDVRRISNALRPPILEDLGLPMALQSLCKDLEKQVPAIQCICLVMGEKHRLPPEVELAIYRVVQEALVNIRKHVSNATRVDVELIFEGDNIQAVIRNDGLSIPVLDMRSQVRTGHLGLAGMYERARLFHGDLDIISEPGSVTTITLRLPIEGNG